MDINESENGEVEAQNNLGECYYYGHGVEQDFKKAVYWYTKAAEQNFGFAQKLLGNCYLLGSGVPQDNEKAKMWHDKAKENGCEFDEELLQEMKKTFNP